MKWLVALVLLVTALSGCGNDTAADTPGETPMATTTAPSGQPAKFVVAGNEPVPNGKRVAVEVTSLLTNYERTQDPKREVSEALSEEGFPSSLADTGAALFVPDKSSRGEIVYAQMAGYRKEQTSVMVAVRQTLTDAQGKADTAVRVVSVHMNLDGEKWQPDIVESTGGMPIERPKELSTAEEKLLDNPAIELTDSARWDVHGRKVDPRVIDALNRLAEKHNFSVLVIKEGHPVNVFATDRTSNHNREGAADIWKLDGRTITDQRDERLKALGAELLANGVTELGSPFDLDGPASPKSFTDVVHQDHLHVGFECIQGSPGCPPKSPPAPAPPTR